jgi:beta-phosphoglucomutase-like phosphatase (HAD superfamily)
VITRPDAVVFDCDGVLVDSEPHSVAAWVRVLADLGHPGGAVEVEGCTGLGFRATWEALRTVAPLPDPATVWGLLIDALEQRFDDPGLERFADSTRVLDRCLAARVPVAVVSASPRERLDLTLDRSGLSDAASVTISGDDVERGKPAPDAYLAAAAALGVDPTRCVAIEDSPAGAASGIAAGMRVIAVVRRPDERVALAATGAEVVDELTAEVAGV